jgi:hypothetical protein
MKARKSALDECHLPERFPLRSHSHSPSHSHSHSHSHFTPLQFFEEQTQIRSTPLADHYQSNGCRVARDIGAVWSGLERLEGWTRGTDGRVGGDVVGWLGLRKREDQVGGIEPDAWADRGKATDRNRHGGRGSTKTTTRIPRPENRDGNRINEAIQSSSVTTVTSTIARPSALLCHTCKVASVMPDPQDVPSLVIVGRAGREKGNSVETDVSYVGRS